MSVAMYTVLTPPFLPLLCWLSTATDALHSFDPLYALAVIGKAGRHYRHSLSSTKLMQQFQAAQSYLVPGLQFWFNYFQH